MNTNDAQREDGRVWGRGTKLKTIKSVVTKVEQYRIHIQDFGWVTPNGFQDIPLNKELYITLAKNGESWLFADWIRI